MRGGPATFGYDRRMRLATLAAPALLALALHHAPSSAERAKAEPRARIAIAEAQSMGRADAPLVMVEFTDYECGFCQQFHGSVFPRIKREFIDTGKVRYVVRDFPLPKHRHAVTAARAARCAALQGRFWEMRDLLMRGESYDPGMIAESAQGLGIDAPRLRDCMADGSQDAAIRRDVTEAAAAGIRATPSFVLGRNEGEAVDGVRFAGLQPFEAYEARIRALLPATP